MSNKQNTLASNRKVNFTRFAAIALMIAVFMMFSMPGILVANAALDAAMEQVLGIVQTAGTAIGALIAVWGIFQIILAMRREDSEAISKQITTVAVGAALILFANGAPALYETLATAEG